MLTLRDYAEGAWRFIAVCEGCGRESRVEPADVLARSQRAHGGMAPSTSSRPTKSRVAARARGDGARRRRGPAAVPGVRAAGAAARSGGAVA